MPTTPDLQITPAPLMGEPSVVVQPGDVKIPLARVLKIVTTTVLATFAAAGIYYGFVMRMGVTEAEVQEHVSDSNAHIPVDFYRDNGLPLGERKAERMLEQVKVDVTAVVEQKFGEVADMIEDAHGGQASYRQRRRMRARRESSADP